MGDKELPYYKMRSKITIICLAILIIASTVSYIPDIFADAALYGRLGIVIMLSVVTLLAFTGNFKELVRNSFFNKLLFPLMIFTLLITTFYAIGFSRVTATDIMQIGIIYVSMWIGHELVISQKTITSLVIMYAILAIYLCYTSASTFLGVLSMDENLYLIEAKNQIGVIAAYAAMYMVYIAQTTENKKLSILTYGICIILIALMLIIRCRTALLAFIIGAGYIVFKVSDTKRLFILFFVGFFVVLIFSEQIFSTLQDAFIGDRNIGNLDELSSNRMERNEQGLLYLQNNLFIGEMQHHSGVAIIHNYVINRLVRYGIWGLPLIFIYFVIGIRVIKQLLLPTKLTFADIGYIGLIIPLFCSLLEPDAPFGPGTVQAFAYIMLGYSIKNSMNKL